MKAMKAAMRAAPSGLTAGAAIAKVAEGVELKPKQVKAVLTAYLELAAAELKKHGKFKLGGILNMKIKKKPARAARKGVNPFTKEPCVFKAKPASKTVRVLPMKKLKEAVN
jgi:nucleoid DNA-binding protein